MSEQNVDMRGFTVGRWTVLHEVQKPAHILSRSRFWLCKCSCGEERKLPTRVLKAGNRLSCGCYQRERAAESAAVTSFRHGYARVGKTSPEYRVWAHIIGRCHNPSDRAFYWYGARGISVCDRWRESFTVFLADVGHRPSTRLSLDRIDNNGNYEPGNVRWATRAVQGMNRRNVKLFEFRGQKKILREWSEAFNMNYGTLRARVTILKWSLERALTTPGHLYHRRSRVVP